MNNQSASATYTVLPERDALRRVRSDELGFKRDKHGFEICPKRVHDDMCDANAYPVSVTTAQLDDGN